MALCVTASGLHARGVFSPKVLKHLLGRDIRSRVLKGFLHLGAHDGGDGPVLAVEGAKRRAGHFAGGIVGARREARVDAALLMPERYADGFAGPYDKNLSLIPNLIPLRPTVSYQFRTGAWDEDGGSSEVLPTPLSADWSETLQRPV